VPKWSSVRRAGAAAPALAATLLAVAAAGSQVLPGSIGALHHPIRTASASAQKLFDRGLTLFYGFNREGARRSFLEAARLDPAAAMPLSGLALAAGPNLNSDPTRDEIEAGCAAARSAKTVAREADERAYAEALAARYCSGLTFDSATGYAIDTGELFQRRPDDPDAAVLYADSLLSLRPRSAEQHVELVAVLEQALKRWPEHVGANHYYIHAVEGSRQPERARPSAQRLETMVPAIGHLLHMPAHIYSRTGEYARAIESNQRAVEADVADTRATGGSDEQRMYYHHDLESLAVAAGFAGRLAVAHRAGVAAASHDRFSPVLGFALLRFSRWEDALRLPAPATTALPDPLWYRVIRSVAHARLGQVPQAAAERDEFKRLAGGLSPDTVYRQNQATLVVDVFAAILDARLAAARGEGAAAIGSWERAVKAQDRLEYHEPPPVYYPARESLGAARFHARQFAQAEAVFRDDLARNPRNPRSLFGLWQTLVALGRREEAVATKRLFDAAWAGSDVTLSLTDY
jgi:tetratricopeptide (TPR) repeat protein